MSRAQQDPDRDRLLEHESDGIREFDNALPRWWLYGFYVTIAFSIVYMVNYHVLATPVFGQPGMVAEYEAEMAAARLEAEARGPRGGGAGTALVALTDQPSLEAGRALYDSADNVCFSCHRPDLGGMIGPNLTDDYWMHGCSVDEVIASIRTGYPLKGMMPYGTNKVLDDEQLLQLASYVLSTRGSTPPDPKPIEEDRERVCP